MKTRRLFGVKNAIFTVCQPTVVCPLCCRLTVGSGTTVCPDCVDELRSEVGPYSSSVDVGDREIPCLIAAEYRGRTKRAIEIMKFTANRRVARLIGDLLLEPLLQHFAGDPELPNTVIVPIPASVAGRWQRGFDQVAALSKNRGIPVVRLLDRKRGVQQKTLDKAGRRANAIGQYSVRRGANEPRYRGYDVIVVDDVMTTGASIETCLQILTEEQIHVRGVAVCTAAI